MSAGKAMAIVLAAGEGKRMRSSRPKVLHEVGGEPILARVGRTAREAGIERVVVVVGRGAEAIREAFPAQGWEFVVQTERLGTGDAVKRARRQLEEFDGEVVVLAGDVPLLKASTVRKLRARHREEGASATVLTARLADPSGYGRILRSEDGTFRGIVEDRDATPEQLCIDEVNSSIYCFDAGDLCSALDRLERDNAQGEEYLTDAIGILEGDGKRVVAVPAASPEEILGVNTPDQLRRIEEILASGESSTRGTAP